MNALLIDDEPLARLELRNLLRNHPAVNIVGEAASVAEALNCVAQHAPELLFLDIQMPDGDGFTFLEQLPLPHPHVIFTTAYSEHALRAFEMNALDYLTKPIHPARLAKALEKVLARASRAALRPHEGSPAGITLPPTNGHTLGNGTPITGTAQTPTAGLSYHSATSEPCDDATTPEPSDNATKSDGANASANSSQTTEPRLLPDSKVFLRDGDRCWFVEINAIRLLESEGNYTRVIFDKAAPLIPRTLQALESRLPEPQFQRANRSQIVNTQQITSVEPWFSGSLKATLKGGEIVEFSRRYAKLFRDRLGL